MSARKSVILSVILFIGLAFTGVSSSAAPATAGGAAVAGIAYHSASAPASGNFGMEGLYCIPLSVESLPLGSGCTLLGVQFGCGCTFVNLRIRCTAYMYCLMIVCDGGDSILLEQSNCF